MSRCEQGKPSPQRTCLACRAVGDKRDFVRLVRTSGGVVEVDRDGKKAGRGAYLCAGGTCLSKGIKKERIEKALRTRLEPGNIKRLEEDIKGLVPAGAAGDGRS